MANGIVRAWRDGDEHLYPVREGRCVNCENLFVAGQMVQERPARSRVLYHNDPADCRIRIRVRAGAYNGAVAPHVASSDTSKEAAVLVGPKAATLRANVLMFLVSLGHIGATDEEIQDRLKMPANTERPRRRELEADGLVVRTDATRYTKMNRRAHVYVITDRGKQWAVKLHEEATR